MKFISICSGIEAASVAFGSLGWKAIAFSEIEPFPCAVLAHHYPEVPNFGDMTKFREWPEEVFANADAIVGGPPCQAFSVAGLRNGLNDDRGNLTLTYAELINHADAIRIRHGKPPVVVLYENVPGLLSDKTGAFGCFLGALAGEDGEIVPPGGKWTNAGCVSGPQRALAWSVTDAQFFGVAQRRRRVFVVTSAREGFNPAAILFEPESLRRDTPPSREAGENITGTVGARTSGGCGFGTDFECAGGLQPVASTGSISHCLNAGGMGRLDYETETMIVHGTQDQCTDKHLAFAMGRNSGQENVVCLPFDTTQVTSVANRSNPQPGDPCHPLASGAHAPSVCYSIRLANTSSNWWGVQKDVTHTLDCTAGPAIGIDQELNGREELAGTLQRKGEGGFEGSVMTPGMQVRRLTPVECSRLQGFPDDYLTQVPWRGKVSPPDGPMYKALGNSWAVPNVLWIGRRIQQEISK